VSWIQSVLDSGCPGFRVSWIQGVLDQDVLDSGCLDSECPGSGCPGFRVSWIQGALDSGLFNHYCDITRFNRGNSPTFFINLALRV